MYSYWVYILASKQNGTLYVGVTSDIARRIYEHKTGSVPGFTKRYNVTRLVHAEEFDNISDAIEREKCLKNWRREWKLDLIESQNPEWKDLYDDMI
jgi:putative endonuclease